MTKPLPPRRRYDNLHHVQVRDAAVGGRLARSASASRRCSLLTPSSRLYAELSSSLGRCDSARDLDDPAGTLDRPGRVGLRDVVRLVLSPGLHRQESGELLGNGDPVGPGTAKEPERLVVILAISALP